MNAQIQNNMQQVIDKLNKELEEENQREHLLTERLKQHRVEIERLKDQCEEVNESLHYVSQKLENIQNSRSWRYTEPIRNLSRLFRRKKNRR